MRLFSLSFYYLLMMMIVLFLFLSDKFAIIIIKNMVGKRLLLLLSCISTLFLFSCDDFNKFPFSLFLSLSQLLVGSISFRSETEKHIFTNIRLKKKLKNLISVHFHIIFFVHFTTYD